MLNGAISRQVTNYRGVVSEFVAMSGSAVRGPSTVVEGVNATPIGQLGSAPSPHPLLVTEKSEAAFLRTLLR